METMIRATTPNLRLVESTGHLRSPASTSVSPMFENEMRLMEKLQTTLDVEKLISIFNTEARQLVQFDGIDYLHESETTIALRIGEKTTHRCIYSLKIEENTLGDIVFYRRKRFQERELNKIEVLLSSLIYPLRNALQYKEAVEHSFTDPLTGAQNRASMDQSLTREVELAKRQGSPLSIILIDADHFKSVNDIHGHSHGDEVLKAITQVAKDTIRQSDVIYRFGGEEFLVLLGQTETDGATLLADRIRENIEELNYINGIKSDVTASLGVTTLNTFDDCKSLFNRADKALYQAKESGRNKVITLLGN